MTEGIIHAGKLGNKTLSSKVLVYVLKRALAYEIVVIGLLLVLKECTKSGHARNTNEIHAYWMEEFCGELVGRKVISSHLQVEKARVNIKELGEASVLQSILLCLSGPPFVESSATEREPYFSQPRIDVLTDALAEFVRKSTIYSNSFNLCGLSNHLWKYTSKALEKPVGQVRSITDNKQNCALNYDAAKSIVFGLDLLFEDQPSRCHLSHLVKILSVLFTSNATVQDIFRTTANPELGLICQTSKQSIMHHSGHIHHSCPYCPHCGIVLQKDLHLDFGHDIQSITKLCSALNKRTINKINQVTYRYSYQFTGMVADDTVATLGKMLTGMKSLNTSVLPRLPRILTPLDAGMPFLGAPNFPLDMELRYADAEITYLEAIARLQIDMYLSWRWKHDVEWFEKQDRFRDLWTRIEETEDETVEGMGCWVYKNSRRQAPTEAIQRD